MSGPTSIFHLITSDEISIPVDRELLRSQSAVFRDMLELSSTSGEGGESCQVSETAEELVVFVAGLDDSYSICAELAILVRLADKYDAPLALAHAVTGCWRLIWLGKEPLSTFALATRFDDAELRNAAAVAATPHFTELKELDELECDSEWKTRLTLLRFQRLDYAREILSTQHSFEMQHPQLATRRTPSCPDSAEHEASRVWSEATLNLLTGLSTTTDVVASFERSLRLTQVGEAPCAECQEQLEAWVQILGRLWKHEPGVL